VIDGVNVINIKRTEIQYQHRVVSPKYIHLGRCLII
jgi:hypothetical protein